MWLSLPVPWVVALNCLGIPLVHLLASWGTTRCPANWFDPGWWPFRRRGLEKGGRFYESLFFIRRWKRFLPDAAPWFQGFPKGELRSSDPEYLKVFIVETCRGEFAHWLQLAVISGFVAWNPYPANLVIVAYALLSNLPCILSLRYTRCRLGRVVMRMGKEAA